MLYALIIVAAASRLLPHPPNFACIAAAGLFAGCYLRGWRAMAVPAAALLLSDIVGHFAGLSGMGFYSLPMMIVVYGSMTISTLIGKTLRESRSVGKLITASVATSTVFFLLTNTAFWLTGVYGLDAAGLVKCFVAAMPFFQYTAAGDLFFCAIMFGTYELSKFRVRRLCTEVVL